MTNTHALPAPTDAGLTLVTLGGAALFRAEGGTPGRRVLGPGKPLALLAYLALGPGRSATREHLVDLLWSDAEPIAGDHAFRQTLWCIRHQVSLELIRADNGGIALAATLPSDRDAFLAAFERRDFDDAVAKYTGEFLPGFALPGGADFEQWADSERFRLRSSFLRAAEVVTRRHLREGSFREAAALARRLRDQDVYDERGWRLLLETLTSAGDFVAAVVEAERVERLLDQENREPEPATRAAIRLARQAPAAQPDTPQRVSLVAELVGREREFAALVAAWERARGGEARHVHVTAPAGLGKTRLLADLRARLRAVGGRVVSVRANPGERGVAYAFAGDLAAALAAVPGAAGVSTTSASVLLGLNPALSSRFAVTPEFSGDEAALRRRTFALGDLIHAVADEAPLALLVDDVHWADSLSRRLLAGALAKLVGCRVLAVTAARPVPEDTLASDGCERLSLPPLGAAQVAALVSSLGAMPSDEWASTLAAELSAACRGSPLLTLETVQLLIEHGTLCLDRDGWSCRDPQALVTEIRSGSALRRRIEEIAPGPAALLLTLAHAGTPLTVETVARAASRSDVAVRADLDALEQRGLASRVEETWVPAHDEIANLAVETATPEATRATHAALGEALAEAAGEDPSALARAAQHLLSGRREDRLGPLFRIYFRRTRQFGARRSLRAVAAEFLGEHATPERTAALVGALPLHIRTGLTSPARIAALIGALAVAAGSGAYVLLLPPPLQPDAILVAQPLGSGGDAHALAAAVFADDWDETALTLSRTRRFAVLEPPPVTEVSVDDLASSPDGTAWAYSKPAGPGGERDIFVRDARGAERRLTADPRGDFTPCWSPDGRWLAFSTERWNAHAWADLAVTNVATGEVRQLTSGDASDGACSWSPDGTRIAFSRGSASEMPPGPARVCTVAPDGTSVSCTEVPGWNVGAVLGWADDRSVWVRGYDAFAQSGWGRVTLDGERLGPVDSLRSGTAQVSPDGRWIATSSSVPGLPTPRWRVFPASHPERARFVAVPRGLEGRLRLTWLATRRPHYLDRLHIRAPRSPVPSSASTRLRADGFDSGGALIPVPPLRWRSTDTALATVDEASGVVSPRRPGRVAIVVTAGGWRSASVELAIGPPQWRTVIEEDWVGPLEDRWVPWGVPRPFVSRSPTSAWLFPNGDSTYTSGVYSRQAFAAASGLGMDVVLSTPLTMLQWQYVSLEITAALDETALRTWDHRTASPPTGSARAATRCGLTYPQGDGRASLRQARLSSPLASASWPMPAWVPTGRAWTLRIQYFPDGTCGFAINGRPAWRDTLGIEPTAPLRSALDAKSVRTRFRIGSVEVWEGVRDGVDWMVLDRSAAQRPRNRRLD
jgi:DNA-binding SARP family transcriptional activator